MKQTQLMGAVALALAATCAQAQETTWRVEFFEISGRSYGFSWGEDPVPPFERMTLSGLVTGEDRNRDGWIDVSELSELRFGNDGVSGNYATCGTWSSSNNYCTLDRFQFAPEGPLGPIFEMTGRWHEAPSDRMVYNVWVETGEQYRYEFYRERYGSYFWTADTTLQVTQISPVPEPSGGLMLAAGLAAVLGARRWRLRAPNNSPYGCVASSRRTGVLSSTMRLALRVLLGALRH